MPTITLGGELIEPLDKIMPILNTLPPVKQQQIIEMLLVTHLHRFGGSYSMQGLLMKGFTKHVWQLLEQAEKMEKT